MKKGIDVSENNGCVDWETVKAAGIDFAIIRLGYGNRHLDERFYENVNGAIAAGLQIGVYYYSYALDAEAAEHEADFLVDTLLDCGLTADRLPMGVWFDMEDADGYKARNGVTDGDWLSKELIEQASSLENANLLLKEYEEEARRKQRRIERQRNIAYVLAAVAVIFCAVK